MGAWGKAPSIAMQIYRQNLHAADERVFQALYRVGQKNEATLHFREYPAIHFPEYLANYKI